MGERNIDSEIFLADKKIRFMNFWGKKLYFKKDVIFTSIIVNECCTYKIMVVLNMAFDWWTMKKSYLERHNNIEGLKLT